MNNETVRYLADLARLSIPDAEQVHVANDLENILGFVDEIQKVETSDTGIGFPQVNTFREDTVAGIEPAYDLVDAAAMHQDHFIKVPKVL